MNKKFLAIFIIIVLLAAALAAWYFLGAPSKTGGEESDSGGFFSNLFPDIGPSGREEEEPGDKVSTTTPHDTAASKLYRLVPESVSGAMFINPLVTSRP